MKILIVRTFPSIMNFKQYNVQEIGLAKALVRKGHECGIVFYNGKSKDEVEYIPVDCGGEIRSITVYKLHGFNILKNGFFPSLRKITKEYDVIQMHEYDQITSWLYYAWSKKPVVIYHGPYYDEFNKGYNLKCKVFDNVFLRIKHNQETWCMTKSVLAMEFLKSKGFKNVISVGVGLDVDNFSCDELQEGQRIEVNSDKFTLLYVGKIEERRNSLFLADIFNVVAQKYENISFIVIGNGDKEYCEKFLEKINLLLLKGKGAYYESATQVQLADLYQRTSLMLFPSSYEIFGMVLLEAAYFGLPIISSENGGAEMVIGHGSRVNIVENFDENLWIQEIEKEYVGWLEREKKGAISIGIKQKELLWDNISSRMINIYELQM